MDEGGLLNVVELLLPVYDSAGEHFPQSHYDGVRAELTARFGGVTAFLRAPAQGLWKEEDGKVVRDDIVIFEVMTPSIDRAWWREYRERLRRLFEQDELIVRASEARLL